MPRTPELTRYRPDIVTEDLLEVEVAPSFLPLPPAPRLPTLLPPIPSLPLPRFSSRLPPIPLPPVPAPPPPCYRARPTEPPTRARRAARVPAPEPPPSSPSSTFPPSTWSAPPAAVPMLPAPHRHSALAGVVVGALLFLVIWIAVAPSRAPAGHEPKIVATPTQQMEVRAAAPPSEDAPISVNALPIEPAPARAPVEPAMAMSPRTAPRVGTGTLNVNSIPIGSVVVDGRPVGSTPVLGLSVSAGAHSVLVVHPELGRKSVRVDIGAGQHKAVAVRFDGPTPLGG